jgi:hypothetical protein
VFYYACAFLPLLLRRKHPSDPARAFSMERGWRAGTVSDARRGLVSATAHCTTWWIDWLSYEEDMPNEKSIIHREIVWEHVYETNYVPDAMFFWPDEKPLHRMRSRNPNFRPSRARRHLLTCGVPCLCAATAGTTWSTTKKAALRSISVDLFGFNSVTNEPNKLLQLRSRAGHSNFAECDACRKGRLCAIAAPCPFYFLCARHLQK